MADDTTNERRLQESIERLEVVTPCYTSGDALTAAVTEVHARHSIAGVDQPRQGITQTVPEPLVLCLSCGWMRSHEYAEHLSRQVAQAVRERGKR